MRTALEVYANLPILSFAPGEELVTEGGLDSRLLFLLDGEVRVIRGSSEVVRIRTPGAVFGEMSALLDIPYSASVIAVTPTRAHVCDHASGFIEANPAIAIHLARTLASRLYHTTSYLADIKRQFADQADHLGILDEVLEEILQMQRHERVDLSRRLDDPRL